MEEKVSSVIFWKCFVEINVNWIELNWVMVSSFPYLHLLILAKTILLFSNVPTGHTQAIGGAIQT